LNIKDKLNTKRISIDLPENLVLKFDQLRKEWGLRARGPVIEKLLKELLLDDELILKNQQQSLNFESNQIDADFNNYHENCEIVLIESKLDDKSESKLDNKAEYNDEKNKLFKNHLNQRKNTLLQILIYQNL